MSPLLLAAVPAGIAFVIWAILDLERFVLIVVLGACVYPASLAKPGGANVAAVDVFLVLALVSWLANNALGNAPDPVVRNNKLIFAGALFAGLQWVSLIWSVRPHSTIKFGIQALELFIAFPVLFASVPRRVDRIEEGVRVLLLLTAVMGVWLVVTFARSSNAAIIGTYVPGLQKNAAGSFQAVGVVIGYCWLLERRLRRPWVVVCLVIDIAGLGVTESRGAILGAMVGITLVSVLRRRGKMASLALFAALGAFYFAVIAPGESAKTSQAGSHSSSQQRIAIWKEGIHQISERPFLGSGGGTYVDTINGQTDPNNTILLTWAEDGIPGILALGFIFVVFGVMVKQTKAIEDERIRTVAVASAGAVVTLFAHFEVDVTWARGAASLAMAMIGLLLALERISVLQAGDAAPESAGPDPELTAVQV